MKAREYETTIDPTRRVRAAIVRSWISICGLGLLAACGSGAGHESEDYGNLLASPGGLVVLEEEHPTGWMRPDCFACHQISNIHQVNRTDLTDEDLDLAGIRDIVRNQGEESCTMCHGSNGVSP
jgi:hypothetical protein